jgi:hypothetical protein
LVDVLAPGSERIERALERALDAHNIGWQRYQHYDEGFVRYFVNIKDLVAAQALLPAIAQIAEMPAEAGRIS